MVLQVGSKSAFQQTIKYTSMISTSEYVKRKDILTNTLFVITPIGHGYYVESEKLYTREEFQKKYPLPFSLISHNTKSADGSKNYLSTD